MIREDIPVNVQHMFELLGEEKFRELVMAYGGTLVYIPHIKNCTRGMRNREIIRRFNGGNSSQLAREYGISDTQVRRILKL